MPKDPVKEVEILTIEEAKERGLIQIVKQLEIDRKTRIGLGLEDITDKSPKKTGPRKKSTSVAIAKSKLIRTNFNNLA
mgnify:CR=1 FL=1